MSQSLSQSMMTALSMLAEGAKTHEIRDALLALKVPYEQCDTIIGRARRRKGSRENMRGQNPDMLRRAIAKRRAELAKLEARLLDVTQPVTREEG